MKNEREGKNRARLCIFYIFIYLYILQWMQGNIYRDVFPTFLTKKSYGWWITMRRMEIYTKISEEKYPKLLVTTIRKLQENTHALCKMAAKSFRSKRVISQPCKILPSAWSDRLPMVVTHSFQLWIAHRLKHWIVDFLSFETTYSINKLDSRKCSKSG